MAICVASLAPTLAIFIAILVFVGGGQIVFLATSNSLVQLVSDPTMRGRVMAVYTIAVLGTTPIGGPLIGWISEQFGPRWGFAVGGVATIAGGAGVRHRVRAGSRAADATADRAADVVLGVDGEAIPASVS